jgi:hypothetical protein
LSSRQSVSTQHRISCIHRNSKYFDICPLHSGWRLMLSQHSNVIEFHALAKTVNIFTFVLSTVEDAYCYHW